MGQVIQAGAGQIPSRQVQIAAGLDRSIGSETINKVCASGMRAVTLADQMIRAGDHDVVLSGGMESMTNAPYLLPQARFGYNYGTRSSWMLSFATACRRLLMDSTWSSKPRRCRGARDHA